ncbi:MAG: hypothetical protein AABY22_34995 [Nanoarchaeota archaeon]
MPKTTFEIKIELPYLVVGDEDTLFSYLRLLRPFRQEEERYRETYLVPCKLEENGWIIFAGLLSMPGNQYFIENYNKLDFSVLKFETNWKNEQHIKSLEKLTLASR